MVERVEKIKETSVNCKGIKYSNEVEINIIVYLDLLGQNCLAYSSDVEERTCLEPNWAENCPASPDQQTENINKFKL